MKYQTQFKNISLGQSFKHNGNTWEKVSSRTAKITKPEKYAGTWFYFGQNEYIYSY